MLLLPGGDYNTTVQSPTYSFVFPQTHQEFTPVHVEPGSCSNLITPPFAPQTHSVLSTGDIGSHINVDVKEKSVSPPKGSRHTADQTRPNEEFATGVP